MRTLRSVGFTLNSTKTKRKRLAVDAIIGALELLLASKRDNLEDRWQAENHWKEAEKHWKEAVLTTIRCAAFAFAQQSNQADPRLPSSSSARATEATLESYCSKFNIDTSVARVLIDGPLGEFLKERDTRSSKGASKGSAESLCKLYEMTLNLVPIETGSDGIKVQIADKARKRRGSFYTPSALSRLTVEAALEPLLDKQPTLSHEDGPSKILQLRILDPAMGAGIFLLAAHDYLLGAAVSAMKSTTGELERNGSPLNEKEISRLIAQNCIYGVDIDDVAVEVAKLALWLAVGDYDLHPLTAFPNLRVGNSLVGVRKELAEKFPSAIWKRKDLAGSRHHAVEVMALDSYFNQANSECERSPRECSTREHLDRWCAYWFMSTEELNSTCPSEPRAQSIETLHSVVALQSTDVPPAEFQSHVVDAYKERLKFFHWNLEFPEIFASENSGFDAVIGNPPWEIEKPNSREFFGSFKKEYWNLGKQDAIETQEELRKRFPQLEREWLRIYRDHYAMTHWIKNAPLQFDADSDSCNSNNDERTVSFQYQGRGDANLYKLFVEQAYYLAKDGGAVGLIVPSGIYSDCGTRELRHLLLDKCDLKRIIGFDNSDGAFDIHRSFKYCILVATRGSATRKTNASFMHTAAQLLSASEDLEGAANSRRNTELNLYDREAIERISPKWSAICEVENNRSLELLEKIHSNGIRLGDCEFKNFDAGADENESTVKLQYAREFDMTLDSKLFHARERLESQGAVQDIFGNWLVGKWRNLSASDYDALVVNGMYSRVATGPDSPLSNGRGVWLAEANGIVLSASGDKFLSKEDISKVFVPLYEGRMIGQFDFNEKQWVSGRGRQAVWRPTESKKILGPQYLVEADVYKERRAAAFKTGFLAVGSPTNARTMISTCLSEVACGNSVPVFYFPDSEVSRPAMAGVMLASAEKANSDLRRSELNLVEFHLVLTSIFNSFVFDYAIRRRMSGNNLNYFVLEECAIPNLAALNATQALVAKTIAKLAVRLVFDAPRFCAQLAAVSCTSVPDVVNPAEKTRLRAAIDALVASMYELTTDEFGMILMGDESGSGRDQKGFWRVDKDLPRDQSLTFNALQMNKRLSEVGCEQFCTELEWTL